MMTEWKEFMNNRKGDILVLGLLLAAALLSWLIPHMTGNDTPGSEVVVFRDGNEIGRYSLSEDDTIAVRGTDDGYNLILISGAAVRVTDADCPDKLCVRQRSISKSGESIICLPHKLVITIDSPEESDIDAVTN